MKRRSRFVVPLLLIVCFALGISGHQRAADPLLDHVATALTQNKG